MRFLLFFHDLIVLPAQAGNFANEAKGEFIELSNTIFGRDVEVDINSPALIVGVFMRWFLGVNGIVFLILTVYAGSKWMGAAGNEEDVELAKKTLTRGIIGMLVSLLGFILLWAVELIIETAGLA